MAQEKSVSIHVGYSNHGEATVKVDPAEVKIYCNRKNQPDDPTLARQVRWTVKGAQANDRVIVRPKGTVKDETRKILNPVTGGASSTIEGACDRKAAKAHPGPFPVRWEYEVAVRRGSQEIGMIDPAIVIDEDP